MQLNITCRLLLFLTTSLLIGSYGIAQENDSSMQIENIEAAEKLISIDFTPEERALMLEDLIEQKSLFKSLHGLNLENVTSPSLVFNPLPIGFSLETKQTPIKYSPQPKVARPERLEDLAFFSIRQLAELVKSQQVTSVELTRLSLERLKKYDPILHCVITLTEELALEQAARADSEISAGHYRGLLHGIPYGAKDLLSAKGYRTTWGAAPYKDQTINRNAAVIMKLEEAGAVLVAKLSLGALAWGDVWFDDTTRNPWNIEQGSSGSSAGPASATSAGLVPFAIGSETWGSIVSPSTRCGVTGLRPTFGRVSRAGAMALSWSMDKLGPICRTVEDCAIVLDAIRGVDKNDPSTIDASFNYDYDVDLSQLRIGYLKKDFENDTSFSQWNDPALKTIRELGAELIPIELPDNGVEHLSIILVAEAAAAFDELTRSNQDDLLVRQIRNAWPNVFRASRFIPAVEYIQANRVRSKLIEQMGTLMDSIDLYISPSFEGNNLLLTNLTGHPCVVLPTGFKDDGTPVSMTFIGKLFDEATLLAVARKYQEATEHHLKHPEQFR